MSEVPLNWQQCLLFFDHQMSKNEYNTMILPIQCAQKDTRLQLYFPNDFLKSHFVNHYQPLLKTEFPEFQFLTVVGSAPKEQAKTVGATGMGVMPGEFAGFRRGLVARRERRVLG